MEVINYAYLFHFYETRPQSSVGYVGVASI